MNTLERLYDNNPNLLKILKAWITRNMFPHAILIEGSKNTDKKELAKYIAASMLCEQKSPPCSNCNSCKKIAKDIHPDFLFYDSEGGSRSFHVDKVREIRKESWIKPNDAKKKVLVLNNAHHMTISAQNALLKIIEEPPRNVFFILICKNKNTLLPTIISRVTSLDTNFSENVNIMPWLQNTYPDFTNEEYHSAVDFSKGNSSFAAEYMESENVRSSYAGAKSLWENLKAKKNIDATADMIGVERQKEEFLIRLEILRGFVVTELTSKEKKSPRQLSLLQLSQVIDIIDEIITSANFNVNMLILTTLFIDKTSIVIKN